MGSELSAVADAIRANDRFLLVTHENPDGDALGSILAMKLALDALGKDSVMYVGGDLALPPDYAFMQLDGLSRTLPEDVAERVIVALDSATAPRTQLPPELLEAAPLTIDVDHHHDNTRYGRINLIVPDASSTGEVLRDVFRELDVDKNNALTRQEVRGDVDLTPRFDDIDVNRDGVVTLDELLAYAERQYGVKLTAS